LRLATAILAYSFGGLKREGGDEGSLPPGVTESELLAACIGPELDSITASAVLSELRNNCLYLHYDGVRYCFKKAPNVTKLIEDAEQEVSRNPDAVREKVKEMLEERLAGRKDALVWPESSQDIPDKEPRFLVSYLPLEFAAKSPSEQTDAGRTMLAQYGDKPRQYRNGVALAVPDRKPIESLRRAVRYWMAVERVDEKKKQLRLTEDQLDQLKERRRTEEAATESAFRSLYPEVWLPRVGGGGNLEIEKVEVGGRPLQATGVHERVMELLTTVGTPKVHGKLHPRKIVERLRLGESLAEGEPARMGISTSDIQDAFFGFLEPPRITSAEVLRRAIVGGVAEGLFAYTTGAPSLGADGNYEVNLGKVSQCRQMSEDEVDLDSGFLMLPAAVPSPEQPPPLQPPVDDSQPTDTTPASVTYSTPATAASPQVAEKPTGRSGVRIRFTATRDQVFKSFPAIANLADKSDGGSITVQIEGTSAQGYDPTWLRNAVEEPLEEAEIGAKVDTP
jgi:hypothetical protein